MVSLLGAQGTPQEGLMGYLVLAAAAGALQAQFAAFFKSPVPLYSAY
jgi:hypothetical protein